LLGEIVERWIWQRIKICNTNTDFNRQTPLADNKLEYITRKREMSKKRKKIKKKCEGYGVSYYHHHHHHHHHHHQYHHPI